MNPLYQKHIISINDLSREELELVLETAAKLKANPQPELLKHKVIASCFFEASTRTRLSFETSMHRLGASVVGFSDSSNTSLGKKGETLADTISVISTYVDAIVMRHPQEGAARLAIGRAFARKRRAPLSGELRGGNQRHHRRSPSCAARRPLPQDVPRPRPPTTVRGQMRSGDQLPSTWRSEASIWPPQ